ncbi:Outer membrane receptor proteins, mostly Fe transport [Aquimarina amphilecti]|uniref:Outer membrane receptor proteins, mostly Fe transport n=1 Tax=Aquimarina amphilecti TaxID=1038014 RepID=A0A1H7NDM8_AQUAM|nr:outer membrane beta-barrel protein [Aquimarina amphilecti]SEL21554.1 Outer membrane receptor proteins, mostly Fe transport [Aquimarina amphilecti]
MEIKKTLFFIMLVIVKTISAQNSIAGSIIDQNQEPLIFANVILYQDKVDQAISAMATGEKGAYFFENIKAGVYRIEVSLLGYESKVSEAFSFSDERKELSMNFVLQSEQLDEVLITYKKPIIKQTAEKLIVDIEKSEMINTNLQDVMKKIPGVIVTNGSLNYGGQGNIRILINGKTTDYMDVSSLLREMPADNIARVELIQQPGAEYDAEGSGPLINVILKKNVKLGTHGNIKSTIGYVDDFTYGTSASVASYKNKLNWQASAGYNKSSWREDLIISRQVLDETYNQTSISPYDPETFRVSGGFDYYVNDKNTIGLNANRIQSLSDRVTKNNTTIINGLSSTSLLTDNSYDRDRVTYTVNPYYEYDNEKNKVTLDFNYIDYTFENENNLFKTEESIVDYDDQRYFQDANYEIFTYKGDYKRTQNDDFSWGAGAKYSQVNSDSDLQAFTENDQGEFIDNANQSNRFLIDESILAVYSKFNAKYNKWSFSGGLRWEESDTEGTSITQSETRSRKISKLFPSVSLGREITEELGANVAYSYRIQRPSYSSLNSFVYYYDPFTFEEGNPNLKPAFTNSFRFNLTYEDQPFFSVSYGQTKDALFEIITQNDTSAETSRSVINLAENNNFTASLFGPLDFIKGLDGYTGIIVNYNEYKSERLTPALDLSKWSLTWYTSAEYKLPWGINSEVSGYYSTGGLEGQIDYEWIAGIDVAISKKFMNDRLKVSIEFEEILNRKFYGAINYDNVNATIVNNWPRQNIFFQLNYNFGSKFSKKKNRSNVSEDEQQRIDDKN